MVLLWVFQQFSVERDCGDILGGDVGRVQFLEFLAGGPAEAGQSMQLTTAKGVAARLHFNRGPRPRVRSRAGFPPALVRQDPE
jgi:hypothetical protein